MYGESGSMDPGNGEFGMCDTDASGDCEWGRVYDYRLKLCNNNCIIVHVQGRPIPSCGEESQW